METKIIFQRHVLPVLFLFCFCLVIFYPVIFGGKIFSNGDSTLYFYPLYSFYSDSLKADNKIPLWLPSIISGFPGAISQIGYYSPINLMFFKFFELFTAYGLVTLLNFFLTAFFSYLFFKLIFKSISASLISALAYSFCQFNIGWGGSINLSTSFWILPLVFLSIYQLSKNKNWWIVFLIPGIIIGFLGAHPQFFIFSLFAGLLFTIFLDLIKTESLIFGKKLFVTFKYATSVVAGFLISYPLIKSLFEISKLSSRGNGLPYLESTGQSLNVIDFVRYVLPSFSTPISSQDSLLYIGIIPLIFAIGAFFIRQKDKTLKFFIFLFIFCLIAAAKYSPIFWLMHKLPVFNLFRNPNQWLMTSSFAMAAMAGYFFVRLLEDRKISGITTKISAIILGLVTFFIVGFNIVVRFFEKNIISLLVRYAQKINYGGGASEETYGSAISKYFTKFKLTLSLTNWEVTVTVILLVLTTAILYLYKKEKLNTRNFGIIVIIIVAGNFALIWHNAFRFVPKEALASEPKTAVFLSEQKKNGQFRIFRFFPGINEYFKLGMPQDNPETNVILEKDTLGSNPNVLFGIDSIGGYENFQTLRTNDILTYLGYERTPKATQVESPRSGRMALEERTKIFFNPKRKNILSMMNVKYVISSFNLGDYFKKVFSTKTVADIPIYIYENKDVLSKIYLIDENNIKFMDSETDQYIFNELIKINNFHKNAIIECVDCKIDDKKSIFGSKLSVERINPENYKITTETNKNSYLIFSEDNIMGWEAKIDGMVTRIYPANYIYQGIFIPLGKHSVEFMYRGI